MGDDTIWEAATEALRNAIEAKGIDYVINPGDGAFYGPKLDYHIRRFLGPLHGNDGTIPIGYELA